MDANTNEWESIHPWTLVTLVSAPPGSCCYSIDCTVEISAISVCASLTNQLVSSIIIHRGSLRVLMRRRYQNSLPSTLCRRGAYAWMARSLGSSTISKEKVLGQWKSNPVAHSSAQSPSSGNRSGRSLGKGMLFAAGLCSNTDTPSQASKSTRSAAPSSLPGSGVDWDICERMDYYVQYAVPCSWAAAELVRDNSLAIQCSPCPAVGEDGRQIPSIHGISLNCFAYKQKVKDPNCMKLLKVFLKRFNLSVGNSLLVLSECDGEAVRKPSTEENNENLSELVATRLTCAAAEITFTPGAGQPLVHGLCRAFYNSNRRFHYVVVVAVPEEEFELSKDLVIHSVVSVVESRVEAAAKRT